MKSKKETLDKYKQGDFINYKNALPSDLERIRMEKLNKVMTNAIRSSDDMVAVVEEAKKQEAIAFGEYMRKRGAFPSPEGCWILDRVKGTKDEFNYATTEELYQEFLKAVGEQGTT